MLSLVPVVQQTKAPPSNTSFSQSMQNLIFGLGQFLTIDKNPKYFKIRISKIHGYIWVYRKTQNQTLTFIHPF
jgi:hypothetical protein